MEALIAVLLVVAVIAEVVCLVYRRILVDMGTCVLHTLVQNSRRTQVVSALTEAPGNEDVCGVDVYLRHSLSRHKVSMNAQHHAPDRFISGESSRCPLDRRLDNNYSRSKVPLRKKQVLIVLQVLIKWCIS
jgi:hypothetical protein